MALPYDPRFNKKKQEAKIYPCGICMKPFKELGLMLQHEDSCNGEYTPPAEGEEQVPTENKNPATQGKTSIVPLKPKLPYGYGQK